MYTVLPVSHYHSEFEVEHVVWYLVTMLEMVVEENYQMGGRTDRRTDIGAEQ